jgi:DNA-binding CsgD family transcriptional regulator
MFKNVNNEYIEAYLFGMNRDARDAENYYFDNNDLLLKFVDYFKDAAKPIIEIPSESHLAHLEQSFDFHQIPDEQLTTDKVSQFLKEVHVEKRLIQGEYKEVKLTKREIECLDYLALGYGMKGVADILDLSSRTVESYINNAKLKTGYSSKQLLLTQFIKDFKNYSPSGC